MDLQLDPEQLQLRDATRRLLGQRLAALVEQLPQRPVHDPAQALRDAQALGWLGLGLPEKAGGAGGFEDLVLVHEELGRGLAPSLATTLTVAGRLLLHTGRYDLLEALVNGDLLLAPAVDLYGDGGRVTDLGAVTHLVLSDGRLADVSEIDLVEAQSECDIAYWKGSLAPAPSQVRAEATILAAARALGGGRAVLERSVSHVTTRHQFDRPIGSFQAVQHQLADVATALDAAGLVVARAAWAVQTGSDDVARAAAMAGLAAGDAFAQATVAAHQVHGGMGFVLDSPLHLWSARAIADPTAPRSRRQLLDTLATVTV